MAEIVDTQQRHAAELEEADEPEVVETASQSPGGDILTGDPSGPFIDTGLEVGRGRARYGNRVYISLKHLAPLLRDLGWRSQDALEDALKEQEEFEERRDELEEKAELYDELLEGFREVFEENGLLEPRVVTKTVTRDIPRTPTDAEVAAFLSRNPDHRLLRERTKPRVGSSEHYAEVYKGTGYVSGDTTVSKPQPGPEASDTSEDDETTPTGQPASFELQGQHVNLDELLSKNIQDVTDFAEGHGEEFSHALATREVELGEIKGDPHPRKGLLEGLGYEYEAFLAGEYEVEVESEDEDETEDDEDVAELELDDTEDGEDEDE